MSDLIFSFSKRTIELRINKGTAYLLSMGRGDFSLPARSRFGEGRSPLNREAKASSTRFIRQFLLAFTKSGKPSLSSFIMFNIGKILFFLIIRKSEIEFFHVSVFL